MSIGWARYAFKFGEYYRNRSPSEMWFPPRLRSREWMFDGFDDRPPERHRGFRKPQDVLTHVANKTPKSCFYSTAYYRDPNQRHMKDKGLMGSDLIFDLDGDHLPGVSDGDFPGMIAVIQDQAYRLWNEFLEPEFGFKEEYLQVTFSGHRGFHLHYRAPDIWDLDSQARRELVSHIKGESVDVSILFSPQSGTSSWQRRIVDGLPTLLSKLDVAASDSAEGRKAIKELKEIMDKRLKSPSCPIKSCGPKKLHTIAEKVQHEGRRNRLIGALSSGEIPRVLGGTDLDMIFLNLLIGDKAIVLGTAGETDEVVTIDQKRVIRWPTSLHGKSGMKVVEFPLERLDPVGTNPFDPLTEAVPWNMGEKTTRVRALASDLVYRIGESEGILSEGEEYLVDDATATFLVLKKWAKPV
ncbi:MAG: DNA primase small subunit domain-containing protein [Candidatus Thermoplasmatota archaeon]|nr:DNA primase small subunit domain-containing protein [Candidatus Thermoplasmatota archaeon]